MAISCLVVLGIAVVSIGIWRLRLVLALVFLGFVFAAAMRPGVEAFDGAVPQGIGVAIHYLAIVGLIALFVWLVVPRALGQVEAALGVSSVPTSSGDLSHATKNSTGVQHEILVALQKRLRDFPSASSSFARTRGRQESLRDPGRGLLRLRHRRLLDLRARPHDRIRLFAHPTPRSHEVTTGSSRPSSRSGAPSWIPRPGGHWTAGRDAGPRPARQYSWPGSKRLKAASPPIRKSEIARTPKMEYPIGRLHVPSSSSTVVRLEVACHARRSLHHHEDEPCAGVRMRAGPRAVLERKVPNCTAVRSQVRPFSRVSSSGRSSMPATGWIVTSTMWQDRDLLRRDLRLLPGRGSPRRRGWGRAARRAAYAVSRPEGDGHAARPGGRFDEINARAKIGHWEDPADGGLPGSWSKRRGSASPGRFRRTP